ncbi:MAG: LamG domain-containing protein [Saprospiraceae bacterium]
MKNYTIPLTILLLLITITSSVGQHDALVRHWSFDNDVSNFQNIINGELTPSLSEGINGKGFLFSDNYLEIKDGVDLMENFTLSFWFKPTEMESNQTLFYQFRQIPGKYDIRNFVRLEIENSAFLLKSEKGRFGLKSIDLVADKWYALSYMYDGTNTKLYLQGQLIYTTDDDISFYQKAGQPTKNRLFIGRSHTIKSQFVGVVDEIKVFQKAIEEKKVAAIYEEFENNTLIAAQTMEINEEIGEAVSYQDVPPSTFSNTSTDIVYVDKYDVLDPLIVRTTGVTLEYYQIKGKEGSELVIVHNDDLGEPLPLSKKKQTKRVALNVGSENSLTFEGFQLERNQKCKVRVNVKSGANIIASYDIDLDKNNVVLPIAYLRAKDKNPRNHKIITVNSKNIEIQVKDNSKVDGDVITIKQEGNTVLDNYSLTDQLKSINVQLKENLHNEFAFIPVDMGKSSGENTALVLILVDGKIIYDFSLRSIDQNRPAKLTIIHEDF